MNIIQDKQVVGNRKYSDFLQLSVQASDVIYSSLNDKQNRFINILRDREHYQQIIKDAKKIQSEFENIVVFGTGGSTLGGQVFCDLKRNYYGRFQGGFEVSFFENVDPESFDNMVQSTNLEKTCFLFVSKSGTTMETISQFLCLKAVFEREGLADKIKKNFLVLTSLEPSPLRKLAEGLGINILTLDNDIGGRFSAFSNVALLPAALVGINPEEVRENALELLESVDGRRQAAESAASALTMAEQGKNIFVLMPYFDCLRSLSRWYGQLWAESTGKNGYGTTPVGALGTVDQHSQLQLYMDGPNDKYYTIIIPDSVRIKNKNYVHMHSDDYSELKYLNHKSLYDVLYAEAKATVSALQERERVVRVIKTCSTVPSVSKILCSFMLETVVACRVRGIDAFSQPAVERGKVIARELLAA